MARFEALRLLSSLIITSDYFTTLSYISLCVSGMSKHTVEKHLEEAYLVSCDSGRSLCAIAFRFSLSVILVRSGSSSGISKCGRKAGKVILSSNSGCAEISPISNSKGSEKWRKGFTEKLIKKEQHFETHRDL